MKLTLEEWLWVHREIIRRKGFFWWLWNVALLDVQMFVRWMFSPIRDAVEFVNWLRDLE